MSDGVINASKTFSIGALISCATLMERVAMLITKKA
jgi:hypothetical protein